MAAVTGLTHLDGEGRAHMIDVGAKPVTARTATASGRLVTTEEVIGLLRGDALPKADAFATARIAGILAAKRTSDLIPLCHGIPVDGVDIDFATGTDSVTITAAARTSARTGVEMEALTAVALAGLTLHDMVKAVDPAATLTEVRLEEKTGGSRGDWTRDGGRVAPADVAQTAASVAAVETVAPAAANPIRPQTARVIVASTRSATGERVDETGPVIAAWLAERGFAVDPVVVTADADVAAALRDAVDSRPALVITTGGTGLGPGDATPDATLAVLDRELPGIAEAIRLRGLESTPTAALSRGVAGIAGGTIVVNLAGSRGAVRDGLGVLDGLVEHLLRQVSGEADHG